MMLPLLLLACTPAPPAWSPAEDVLALAGDPGPAIDGATPIGAQVATAPDGRLVVAWAQQVGRVEGAPWRVVRRVREGDRWSAPERHDALQPWFGLDADAEVILVDPIGPSAWPRTRRPADGAAWGLPQLYRLADLGLKFPLDLEAPRLHTTADGRLLLARRVGPAIAVLQAEDNGWSVVGGMPSVVALPPGVPDARGAPALADASDGRIAVAWRVAKEGTTRVGDAGRVDTPGFGGVAVEVWDGTRWTAASSPAAPALVEPWPEGPDARRAQLQWRTVWGERQDRAWPGDLDVSFDGDALIVDWDAAGGRRRSTWDGAGWTHGPAPADAGPIEVVTDAAGARLRLSGFGGGLSGGLGPLDAAPALARGPDGPVVVRVDAARSTEARLVAWPSGATLPAPHAGDLQLGRLTDGRLLAAWRDQRRAGGALHAAVLDGGTWTRLPGPGPESSVLAAPARADRVVALGGTRPTLLVRRGDGLLAHAWDGATWSAAGPALEVREDATLAAAFGPDGHAQVLFSTPDPGWQRWRLDDAWTPLAPPDACGAPDRLGALSLTPAAPTWVSWTSRDALSGSGRLVLCAEAAAAWTRRDVPPLPTGAARGPLRPQELDQVTLATAGEDLLALVSSIGPAGPSARVFRLDTAGWAPLLATPDRAPIAWPQLSADASGACLAWAEGGADGPHLALQCARRGR